ncbi:hypothetical protein LN037_01665 [Actinomycetospora sp. SF1]|nr:hypothetical protein [Actinomycetospora soli]MCD2185860.1 hypothetical protein [Actinomycetospora soli]
MLVPADEGGDAVGEGEAQPRRARRALGVVEPRGEGDAVEGGQQAPVVAEAVEDEAVDVGQHQADGLVGERGSHLGEDRVAGLVEQRLVVDRTGEGGVHGVQRDAVARAALPGGDDPPRGRHRVAGEGEPLALAQVRRHPALPRTRRRGR